MQIKTKTIHGIVEQLFTQQGYTVINDITEAAGAALTAVIDGVGNFVFNKTYLVPIFIADLKYHCNNITCINCNATQERLEYDLYNAKLNDGIFVYYNVGNCNQLNILEKQIKENAIICL